MGWQAFAPLFLAATVEWVEAFTIVLAVSLTIGWAASVGAAVAGLGTLAALTAVTGGALSLGLNLRLMQFIIGVFLLLFGVRWLAKAIARQAGLKALHDEEVEFIETRAALRGGEWSAAWLIAYKGVLLEGLEVWLLVVAFSLQSHAWGLNAAAAGAALALVCAVGAAVTGAAAAGAGERNQVPGRRNDRRIRHILDAGSAGTGRMAAWRLVAATAGGVLPGRRRACWCRCTAAARPLGCGHEGICQDAVRRRL